jgi:large-conductance mechanosensitive channel
VTETVIGLMTAFGLSTATGLNAYLPLLILGGLARWTDLITLDAPYDALSEPGVMLAIGVIAVVDFVGDKVPAIDSVLHTVGVVVAPVAGALVALAATGNDLVDPAVAVVLGVAAAGATHGARSIVRPASTAFTGGAGNPVLSLGEDTVSTVLSFTAVIVPVVAFVLVLTLFGLLFWAVRRAWRRRRGRGIVTVDPGATLEPPARPDDRG